jgi:predicted DNA-binding protein
MSSPTSPIKTHGPNQMTRLAIELPLETRQRLSDQAKKLGVPQIQIIRTGILQFIECLEAQEAAKSTPKSRKPARNGKAKGGAQ